MYAGMRLHTRGNVFSIFKNMNSQIMKDYMFNHINTRCVLSMAWSKITRLVLTLVVFVTFSCSQPKKHEFQSKNESTPLELPDGSMVTLREGARLTYSDDFGDSNREVMIDGEGYFEVKHDPHHRFIAHCNEVAVAVLGTAFNIQRSPETGEVAVTVIEGKANVSDAKRNFGDLLSHRQVIIDPAHHKARFTERLDLNKTLAWYYEGLATGNRGMGTAISALELRYGARIILENQELDDCLLNLEPDFDRSLDDILQVFVMTVNARLIKKGSAYIIRGGHCG